MTQCGCSLPQGPRGPSGAQLCLGFLESCLDWCWRPSIQHIASTDQTPSGLVWSCSQSPCAWPVSRVSHVWRWRTHWKYWLGPKQIGTWLTHTPLRGWGGNEGNWCPWAEAWAWRDWTVVWWCSLLLVEFLKVSVQFSRSVVSDSLQPHELQHTSIYSLTEAEGGRPHGQ